MSALLVTPERAAELLSVSRTQVYVMIASGELASLKVGRLRRIPVAALEAWIERQMSVNLAVKTA